ncbi:ergothioneine biosynthesis protein EgtC [Amycolatopsis mongoliensis]|uniref:Gamma-glutamyl-hercynylcysteine sulfoxide hydrolase n=1 Tax=Amycolatopsis mongoliensis TaxID=715475 RepID=A0A9Y2JLL5_9PSEU|nr:ergothioneine biosynthesis protein EgtC [Amycolatopsis sp. 4-36]WIX99964.1 ergothioneine biosynthesis protein EgtC [Amycolatopsis sp. 4-36]
MCRHIGYLGEPVSPAEAVFRAPHSLLVQSYAPADMRGGGSVNADGFGLGWYPGPGGAAPLRHRRSTPLWTDETLPPLAASVTSGAFVAAVRNGTTGMPVTEAAAAPFTAGRWLFSHNGVVRGWPDSLAELAKTLPVTELLTLEAPTDSAVLWALLRARLAAGEDPLTAVAGLTAAVEAAAPGSRLNFLLTDGETLIGTAWTHALSLLETPAGVLLASEPGDGDPRWRPVPDHHAVRATAAGVDLLPLTEERS